MSKADRLLAILRLLGTGKKMTAKQLAEALEVHVRTVYRDIDAMCASGVPVLADAGPRGGYSLLPRFTGVPLFFDPEEQTALIHAAVFAQEAGYPLGDALNRAVAKLSLYNNPEQSKMIGRRAEVFGVVHPRADESLLSVLRELEASAAQGRTLRIEYRSGYGTEVTDRCIDPYGIVYWRGKWYFVAYCHLRREIRSFRADRILSLLRTEDTFQRPADFSVGEFFLRNMFPDADGGARQVDVRIQGRPQALDDLSKLDPFKDYIRRRMEEGCLNANVIFDEIKAQG